MLKKLDAMFKRCDVWFDEIAKASVARDISEIRVQQLESVKKELRLLQDLKNHGVSLEDAIIIKRLEAQSHEMELTSCNISA